jgi:hypothetical protein
MGISTYSVTINLPSQTVQRLEKSAQQQQQTIAQLVHDLVLQATTPLPTLPPDLENELLAFNHLSDETLWLLARGTLGKNQVARLAWLNEQGGERELSAEEQVEQEELLAEYGRVLVRRAQAAALLHQRGYDLSDTAVLQTEA